MFVKKFVMAMSGFALAAWLPFLCLERAPEGIPFYQQNDMIYIRQSDCMRFGRETLLQKDKNLKILEVTDCKAYSCIAACEGLAIYAHQGEETGVICLLNGHAQYFDWLYHTPRQIAPQIVMLKDGPYACILSVASGTGIQLYELHLLDLKNGQISDAYLSNETLSEAFESVLTNVDLSAQTLTFRLDGQPVQIHLSEYGEPLTLTSLSCGQSINEILFTNGVTACAAIELHTEELLGPIFAGTLQANIRFENGSFQFSDFMVLPE